MSMDFPDYEQIREKSRKYAFLWMLGDRLHYIGVLGSIFIGIGAPIDALFSWLAGRQIGLPLFNLGGLAALIFCLACYSVGIPLKEYSRKRAGVKSCLQSNDEGTSETQQRPIK